MSLSATQQKARDRLVKQRDSIKEDLAIFEKVIQSFSEDPDVDVLKIRMERLEKSFDRLGDITHSLYDIDPQTRHADAQAALESEYVRLLANGRRLLRAESTAPTSRNMHESPNPFSPVLKFTRLPEQALPKFDGKYENWLSFQDDFQSSIGERLDLTDTQKLKYLRSCLNGEPERLVRSFGTTNDSYKAAWKLLKETFEQKAKILERHVNAIYDMPSMQKESATELSSLINTVSLHLSALRSLGEPIEQWSTLLVFLVLRKIDKGTRKEWKRTQKGNQTPSFDDLINFLRETVVSSDDTVTVRSDDREKMNLPHKGVSDKGLDFKQRVKARTQCFASTATNCDICKGSPHAIFRCPEFKSISPKDRHDYAMKSSLCLNCLRPDHKTKECSSKYTYVPRASTTNPESITLVANVLRKDLLVTALLEVIDATGKPTTHRALLDTCSNANFMTDRLATALNLAKERYSIPISSMNQTRTATNHLVQATISSRLNGFSRTLNFLTVKNITGLVPEEKIDRSSLNLPRNKPLADPQFDQPGEIDILIGSGTTLSTLCVGQLKISRSSEPDLYLQNTRLGWIIGGCVSQGNRLSNPKDQGQCLFSSLDTIMNRFWEIEQPDNATKGSMHGSCEDHFLKNTTRDSDGRYTVALPFNEKLNELGESRVMAEKRLASIERKLRRDPALQTQYNEIIKEYIELGHMTKKGGEPDAGGFYLPHHAVIKETSLTTKVRVVFDGSAKSSTGISLNDTLLIGPTIQDDIFSLLLRFRSHNYVLTGDIEKMYRQFWVRETDRKFQRILWRDSDGQIATYELNTITFGLSPAPYLAIRCLHQLADDEATNFPNAAKILKNDLYVDDLLTGTATFEEALSLRKELTALLTRGKLNLRQWASNDAKLLEGLPVNHVNLKLQSKEDNTIKMLGVHWDSEKDSITYTVHPTPLNGRATKRLILSDIARIFDPLGLLGPIITTAKLIMQELWVEKLDWDDAIPLSIFTKWLNYTTKLSTLHLLSFSRKFASSSTRDLQLHGFCDASERAYGACIYMREVNGNGEVTSTLLCAKSRVAPLKGNKINKSSKCGDQAEQAMTIPRLELCAAQLLARLYTTVCKAMQLESIRSVFWSDSTIVLHWIRTSPHSLLPFVSNRVADIQARTGANDWRHVRSGDNPADLISRGQTPDEFILPSIWKHGPVWMLKEEKDWPHLRLPSLEKIPEMRKIRCLLTPIRCELLEQYSSIVKLRRIIAYCLRFKTRRRGSLSPDEIRTADITILKMVQASCFAEELKDLQEKKCVEKRSKLAPLSPFLDQHGLIRIGGRLRNAVIPFEEKHGVILPRNHHLTGLLITYEHLRNYHAGVQATLYALRRRFWILDGRNQIRKNIRSCIRCHKVNPPMTSCQMGDLPNVRVTEVRPFLNVGIDYCGPFFIKERKFRNRGRVKVYVAVFVCLAVKAVHLELVSDMTTEAFIGALKRFIARRGLCKNIYSDNGTTFVGANNEFEQISRLIRSSELNESVAKHLADQGIKWHFMPPQSPNFGGIWEAAVKSFKRHAKRVIGDQLFTFEGLNTFLIEVEAILNSRPLTPISSDPNDLLALTPGHFLIGNSLTSAPETDLQGVQTNKLSSWQHLQKLRQDFWKRWHKEYLTELNIRHKWTHGAHDIKTGTLVLIKEDNQPPLRWPMGRVTETIPGHDGIIRVVRLKTARGIFVRNVRCLSPLPISSESDNT